MAGSFPAAEQFVVDFFKFLIGVNAGRVGLRKGIGRDRPDDRRGIYGDNLGLGSLWAAGCEEDSRREDGDEMQLHGR